MADKAIKKRPGYEYSEQACPHSKRIPNYVKPGVDFCYNCGGFIEVTKILSCLFCSMPYSEFPLDVMVSDEVWQTVTGRTDGSGVVCAQCLVAEAAKNYPNVTVGHLSFDGLEDRKDAKRK